MANKKQALRCPSASPHEHAMLATRWRGVSRDSIWASFALEWMAFNTLYNAADFGFGDKTAIAAAIGLFTGEQADQCLKAIDLRHVESLVRRAPGNDRLSQEKKADEQEYRGESAKNISIFNGEVDPCLRLAALMKVVYQVRCNFIHGNKFPFEERDFSLASACVPILKVVTTHLADAMDSHKEPLRP